MLSLTKEQVGRICQVRLTGRIDSKTAPEFETGLMQEIADGARQLVLDFEEVEFISSAGLRVLLVAAQALEEKDGQLALASVRSTVLKVMEISGFTRLLNVFDSMEDAVSGLS